MAGFEKDYSTIANNYDKMINWEKRLAREIPFFADYLSNDLNKKILDCACATGQHAVQLAQMGYQVTASDINSTMVQQTRELAKEKDVALEVYQSDFISLKEKINDTFDMIICIGNSLPHVENKDELRNSLENMFSLLKTGGQLIIQNRNYDKIMQDKYQMMPMTKWTNQEEAKLFIRINELNSNQKVSFTIITLSSEENNNWRMETERTELYPIQQIQIDGILKEIGFKDTIFYGNYEKHIFAANSSSDLIVVTTK